MMASKYVWETILDYIQYIKDGIIHINAINILHKITQYVFIFGLNTFKYSIYLYFIIL